jgi:hypothetical protein
MYPGSFRMHIEFCIAIISVSSCLLGQPFQLHSCSLELKSAAASAVAFSHVTVAPTEQVAAAAAAVV